MFHVSEGAVWGGCGNMIEEACMGGEVMRVDDGDVTASAFDGGLNLIRNWAAGWWCVWSWENLLNRSV